MDHSSALTSEETLIVLPQTVVTSALRHPLLSRLTPVATGFFPYVKNHLVQRPNPLPEAIIILCVAGQGWIELGQGRRESVTAPSFVYIPAHVPHAYGADPKNPWSIHWTHLRGEEIHHYASLLGLSSNNPILKCSDDATRRIDYSVIHHRLSEDYTLPNLLCAAALIRHLLAELYRLQLRPPRYSQRDPVERTIQWMRNNLPTRPQLGQLARQAGLSTAQYSVLFRKKTAYAPIDYFIRLKIRHACSLLDSSDDRIEEIATAVGYEDPFYFSRIFKKIMGHSPRAYRQLPKG